MREIRKLVRKGTSAYITALANAVHTHNGVSSYTQSPYISQEVNASCMYRVEAYILYYTCCCLSLICWGRATQWRGDNSTWRVAHAAAAAAADVGVGVDVIHRAEKKYNPAARKNIWLFFVPHSFFLPLLLVLLFRGRDKTNNTPSIFVLSFSSLGALSFTSSYSIEFIKEMTPAFVLLWRLGFLRETKVAVILTRGRERERRFVKFDTRGF